jgi:uncharacterized cupredoxin-like copper-binding protein
MRPLSTLVALLILLLWPALALWGVPSPPTVLIKAEEFRFTPKEITIRPGEVIFSIKNEGQIEHNFVIEDAGGKRAGGIASILPDKTDQLRLALRAGRYTMVCDLPGHKDAGMLGSLTVRE